MGNVIIVSFCSEKHCRLDMFKNKLTVQSVTRFRKYSSHKKNYFRFLMHKESM